MALKQSTTYTDIVGLVDRIRAGVEYEVQEHGSEAQRVAFDFRPTMLPDDRAEERDVLVQAGFIKPEEEGESEGEEARVEAEIRRLLDETRDFIDSPDFQTVLRSCLDEVFSLFLPNTFAKTFFPLDPPAFDVPKIREITRQEEEDRTVPVAVPFANLLPAVSRQVHLVVNGTPNEYVKTLAYIKELQGFSAIIYSSFEEVVAAA
ncbi:Peroxin-3 [Jimgerdemannia flammicorona]|uniref:Peroxin-3 n=1 Tax=Jimgerdemannia flammicorona TaxID=994334 RepID=A0A433QE65_9FUNG|nr:Peroxin-3 [Jimgerdemannia flammicorona]